jgi:hypothetical protein
MNMHVRDLTPTQRKAVERRANFLASIAAKAAELADRKTRLALQAVSVAAVEAPLTRKPVMKIVVSDLMPEANEKWTIVSPTPQQPHPARPLHPSVRDIQLAVCEHFDVKLIDIMSTRRTANIVRPRQVAMYLAKTMTLRSLPDIGRRFGGRDHTTALHAIRKIEGLVELDGDIARDVALITAKIKETFDASYPLGDYSHEAPAAAPQDRTPQSLGEGREAPQRAPDRAGSAP